MRAHRMRIFTMISSTILVIVGVAMIAEGDRLGWLVTSFFAVCFGVGAFEPTFSRLRAGSGYRLVITEDGIACEHRRRKRESIRWEDVNRIWYVTTSEGPRLPDEWILLEGDPGGCSFPTEVPEIGRFWEELARRFTGFDYGPVTRGTLESARHLCWERSATGLPTARG
jgi:hypothetical protein